jgi:hypothetical protein
MKSKLNWKGSKMNFDNLTGLGIISVVILVVALVILGPLAIIWALNTLFGLGIAYTFWTWLAVLVLSATIGGNRGSSTKTRG